MDCRTCYKNKLGVIGRNLQRLVRFCPIPSPTLPFAGPRSGFPGRQGLGRERKLALAVRRLNACLPYPVEAADHHVFILGLEHAGQQLTVEGQLGQGHVNAEDAVAEFAGAFA